MSFYFTSDLHIDHDLTVRHDDYFLQNEIKFDLAL